MSASRRSSDRRAKIMCTLGPASRSEETVRSLLLAGMDIVRLNLSHGTHDEHRELIRRVRRLAAEEGRLVPVVLDLMGPRYRLGVLEARRRLETGAEVRIGLEGEEVDLPVEPGVLDYLEPGERMLIDNGLIELSIREKQRGAVTAEVVTGGWASSRKGINLPDSRLPFTISEKDDADIGFAVAEEVDFVAASYVGAAEHLEAIRERLHDAGGEIPLVAKLERAAAVEDLEPLVAAADALMVARGDLGVEVPLHRLPVLQKRIIAAGRRAGRPVIVATQMLESMIEQPRPTRAEATDVANAVFDGADALMLSGETAAGKYPVQAVETMSRIIREAESYPAGSRDELPHDLPLEEAHAAGGDQLRNLATPAERELPDLIAAAAVYAAHKGKVRWIVAFSQGGFTARLIARYRPEASILVFAPEEKVARKIQLVWGVRPQPLASEVEHLDDIVGVVERRLLEQGLVEAGEVILILMGHPIPDRPLTNLMRIHRVRGG